MHKLLKKKRLVQQVCQIGTHSGSLTINCKQRGGSLMAITSTISKSCQKVLKKLEQSKVKHIWLKVHLHRVALHLRPYSRRARALPLALSLGKWGCYPLASSISGGNSSSLAWCEWCNQRIPFQALPPAVTLSLGVNRP